MLTHIILIIFTAIVSFLAMAFYLASGYNIREWQLTKTKENGKKSVGMIYVGIGFQLLSFLLLSFVI